ncbi:RpiR family transcriptional regulator [Halanaerobium saccharolyticum]|uniref:RpiR family transcriptional regulator n=1 Tax=Halanaerobium saccharolyticum TaxID=43595 RepID=A0A4R7Z589_9FIRM|nr:MurR/RpiR family transcriptional regulator [Halanaerobium saccharolyticum]RAK07870.1 RpiR family transcriptional regulator [Halanaerobium saccharolyticum]TDW04484.1 RpiR family transcriptional regulator [Halanaerobium saccharolyticum]TDX59820.1 RpiR family transcriptional regulator [Halanaerobium saccharolyticum]
MKVILKIKAMFKDFTATEKKIADYILNNKEEVSQLSVKELAQSADSSPASVVRFSKKIGYQGFQDFKISLIKDLQEVENEEKVKVYEDIAVDDEIEDIMEKLAHDNVKVINNTINLLSVRELKKAVKAIETAENIYIFGIGASGLVAKDLEYKLMRIKKTVINYADTHAQLASAANIESTDLAIAISYSGESLEVYEALKTAKERGAETISITKYGENPLNKIANIKLQVAGSEKNMRLGAITSRIAQLTAVDILFVAFAKNDFSKISTYLKNTRESVEQFKII